MGSGWKKTTEVCTIISSHHALLLPLTSHTPNCSLRTKRHVIDRELDRVYEARTLEEIHSALEQAGRNLQQLDVFRNLHMSATISHHRSFNLPSPSPLLPHSPILFSHTFPTIFSSHISCRLVHEEPEDDPEAVSVVIDVEEKNWYKLRAATYAQGNETSFELGLGLHNLSGGAEHFTVSGEIGSERSTEFNATLDQPKPFDLPITLTSRLAQSLTNNQKTSSYTEMMRGLALGIKSFDGRHSLEYALGWRRLDADPSGLASKAILAQVDDYVKSAVKYTWQTGNKVYLSSLTHFLSSLTLFIPFWNNPRHVATFLAFFSIVSSIDL